MPISAQLYMALSEVDPICTASALDFQGAIFVKSHPTALSRLSAFVMALTTFHSKIECRTAEFYGLSKLLLSPSDWRH